MIFWHLFYEFFLTGLFSVGGGLATLPFLRSIALRYSWFTPDELLDMVAVSESTPGPIGINTATYAGFKAAGLGGAVTATLSLVLPSVIIIIIISRALQRFRDSPIVQHAFYGLRPASAGLILGAMASVFWSTLIHTDLYTGLSSLVSAINLPAVLLFFAMLLLMRLFPKVHPVLFIVAGAVCGIVFQM